MTDIVLTVSDRDMSGWEQVVFSQALDALAAQFSVAVSPQVEGAGQTDTVFKRLAPGAECQLAIDGQLALSGYVDSFNASYSKDEHSVTVAGRSKVADLIDCSAKTEPGQWSDASFEAIVTDLVAEFGVAVDFALDQSAAVPSFTVEDGETVFEAIERLCRVQSAVATTNSHGALVITNAAARPRRYDAALREGVNILAASLTASNLERYRSYKVLAQHPAADFMPDGFFGEADSEVIDTAMLRHRPLIILAEQAMSQDETAPRARWESNVRAARSRTVRVRVAGSGYKDIGTLWAPGHLVEIDSPRLGVSGEMLIARTQFVLNDQGTQTDLELVLPGAFTPEPQTESFDLGGLL